MNQSFEASEEEKNVIIKKFTQRKSMKVLFFPIVLEAVFHRINCQSQKIVIVLHEKKD
jgi:hypothetical protein